ncbi:hypothetical protein [Peptoniphilus grossensis]|uniref:hypothetical protein n=1 Tax=Peptoniphilus grossensis TaxID=1465756 RepID=UPI0003086421|nr:hypothetical protein [Peptoniphilus grossensis]MDU5100330.1 hypothetical protein [Peptoniphilus grossensis]
MQMSNYMKNTYRYGIIATLLAMALMLGIPAIMCTIYGMWPEWSLIGSVAGPLLALFVPTALAEQLTMIPIGGTTCYLNSILGNVMNIKFPCYLSAIATVDATPGTEEADVMGMIAVTVSGMVSMITIVIGVVLLTPLKPILQTESVATATMYILPALYGSMGISAFVSTSAGAKYKAPKKPLIAIVALAIVYAFNFLVMPIAGKEGYAMLIMLVVTLLISYAFFKSGIVKLEKKEK